ncbi:MAG: (Fe-S)-binding protein [Acidobacteriota bacterium]
METPGAVAVFITCLADLFAPEIGVSLVRVLRRAGLRVIFPRDQICCGQPAFNNGHVPEARRIARRFISAFERRLGPSDLIVAPSGSCALMVSHEYPRLFAGDPTWEPRARAIAARTFEFSCFLANVLKVSSIDGRYPAKITIHDSCHLNRGLGVHDEPRTLLRLCSGIEVVEMERSDQCCGFGGAFSIRQPEISSSMVADKLRCIRDTGADAIVVNDTGCAMQIRGAMSRAGIELPVLHLAQVLDGALSRWTE